MDTPKTTTELEHYAADNIQALVKHDKKLEPIVSLLNDIIALNPEKNHRTLSDDEARSLTKHQDTGAIGTPYSEEAVQIYYRLAKKVLEIATDPESNNKNLSLVAACLHPLLSQDERTFNIGWDLEEYMDWYFNETSHGERLKYAHELLTDWGLDG